MMNMRREIRVSAFISWYLHLDERHSLGLTPSIWVLCSPKARMGVRLMGDSKLIICMNVSVSGCLSLSIDCDGLATCPGCILPLAS